MAYSFNGNDLESCRALCANFYNAMFDEDGHINTFNSNESGELTGEYLGATKDDFYYYRGYAIQGDVSGAASNFNIHSAAVRLPFHVSDNNIRPFFALKHNPDNDPKFEWALNFYVGCKYNSNYKDWNFNNNRYGDANRAYNADLFNNTDRPLRSAYFNITSYGENGSAGVVTNSFKKDHSYYNYYSNNANIRGLRTI